MREYDRLAEAVSSNGYELFWHGPASDTQISAAEKMLGVAFPVSFRRFLCAYGGGGVSGIEDNDAEIHFGGTVVGDTLECRTRFSLPESLLVIYFHEDEICWCLDTGNTVDGECSVVSVCVFHQLVDNVLAGSFGEFMGKHLEMYSH